jgi:anaerobic selenocysteine-containing dehydrogenase
MKRTPSSNKKKPSDSASISAVSSTSDGGVLGEIRLGILFQSRLGAAPGSIACPPNAIHMNAGDMKRIGIMNGTLVRVYIESSSTHLALFAFAALRGGGQPGSAVLSRAWSANFKGEDRNVTVSRDNGRY